MQFEQDGFTLSHFVFLSRHRAHGRYTPGRGPIGPLGPPFERAEVEVETEEMDRLLLLVLMLLFIVLVSLAFNLVEVMAFAIVVVV
jgi:hypothetical protein